MEKESSNKRQERKREKGSTGNQKKVNQRLEMLRWVTAFIEEHQEEWENVRKEREKIIEKELTDWNKAKRLEKIKKLKEKWSTPKSPTKTEIPSENQITSPKNSKWVVWREKNIDPVPSTPTIPLGTSVITAVPSAAKTWTTSPTAGTTPRSTTEVPTSSTIPITASGCTTSSNIGEVTKLPMLEQTIRMGPIIKKAKLNLDESESEKSVPTDKTRCSNIKKKQTLLFQPKKSISKLFQHPSKDSSTEDTKHLKSSIPHNVVTVKFKDENSIPTIEDRKIEDDPKSETKTTGRNKKIEDDNEENIDKIKYEVTLRSPILKVSKKNENKPLAEVQIEKEDNKKDEDNPDRKEEKVVKLRPPKKEDNPKEVKRRNKKEKILPTQKTTMKNYFLKTTLTMKDNPEQQTYVPKSSRLKTRGPTQSSDGVKSNQLSLASDVDPKKTDVNKLSTISHKKSDLTAKTTFTSHQLSEGLPGPDDQPI